MHSLHGLIPAPQEVPECIQERGEIGVLSNRIDILFAHIQQLGEKLTYMQGKQELSNMSKQKQLTQIFFKLDEVSAAHQQAPAQRLLLSLALDERIDHVWPVVRENDQLAYLLREWLRFEVHHTAAAEKDAPVQRFWIDLLPRLKELIDKKAQLFEVEQQVQAFAFNEHQKGKFRVLGPLALLMDMGIAMNGDGCLMRFLKARETGKEDLTLAYRARTAFLGEAAGLLAHFGVQVTHN